MNDLYLLAQTAENGSKVQVPEEGIVPMDYIWEQIESLTWPQAVIAMSFGAVYLLYGWRIFKILVVIAAALVGMALGIKLGKMLGDVNWQIWTAIGCGIIAGGACIPLMRWAVCAMGAIAGGILTSGIWYAFNLPEKYIFAGALIGIIAGGMISFIVFRAAVMLFTCLGGGSLVILSFLSLLRTYEPTSEWVHDWFFNYKWFLPSLLIIPTVIGIIVQNNLIKGSKNWDL
jgi:hypothetical protein